MNSRERVAQVQAEIAAELEALENQDRQARERHPEIHAELDRLEKIDMDRAARRGRAA